MSDIENPNRGEGWYEFIDQAHATTHICYVYANGDSYHPEGTTHDAFMLAAVNNQAHKLIRADSVVTV